ncbi:hypothetical protein BC936DRAFT_144144 [Jimgerdemannia flammicorona]|uniref:UspA domain-containing protein n=1 Tax=Jimgerdemannia flammicorona TaxID=994334 RepID=A0A433DCX9_9FUNG|nr:hypothetical protein BC936DRAFT_144144 [Jimgerdemannia flammicorona]
MSVSTSTKPPRKVVVALDSSASEARHTAEWAINNILDPARDKVDVINAISLDSEFDATELGKHQHHIRDGLFDGNATAVNEALKQFVELFKSHGIPAESHALKSRTDSRNVIVDYTNSAKADLLILGSRDLTGWKR